MTEVDVNLMCNFCEKLLNLKDAQLSDEYYYNSLPLCIIDAVYSINAKYTSTRNTVIRYCDYFDLKRIRDTKSFANKEKQHTINEFIYNIEVCGLEYATNEIFKNKQRTSTKNGILKSEAILKIAKILKRYEINTLQDFNEKYSIELEDEIRSVKGQSKGTSIAYLRMLAGNDNFVKVDRHIMNFVEQCINRRLTENEIQLLFSKVVIKLKEKYNNITVRLLDNTIWKFMSNFNGYDL